MTVLRSSLFEREGFEHGFGTRRSIPDDLPADTHVLLQVHGQSIVVLTEGAGRRVRGAEERSGPATDSRQLKTSGIPVHRSCSEGFSGGGWKLGSGIAGSGPDVKISDLPADPFRFDEGDAMASAVPGVSMGIRTADCLPLLIADRVKGTAAAVHCGWRSLAMGLAGRAVKALTEVMGSRPEHLLAAIGPSIGACCYEVGEDVWTSFKEGRESGGLFEEREGKLFLDLASGAKTQLINTGMNPEAIDEIVGCTSCNGDLFWSHRARREEERMVSFIRVREPY